MALIGLKQLDSVLTGSLVVSGSHTITGSLYVSASIFGEGLGLGDTLPSSPATDLHIKSDTPVITLQRTNNNQKSAIDFQGSSGTVGASIEFVVDDNDLSFQTFDGSNTHEKLRLEDGASGNIKVSGSTQITGSLYVSASIFGDGVVLTGNMTASGNISASGNIRSSRFEIKGADNYIDRAWDGSLFLVSAVDVVIQPGGGELIVNANVVPDTDSADDLGSTSKYWRNAYIDSVTTTGNVSGSLTSTGSFGKVEATSFSGDGSNLTGINVGSSGIFVATGSSYNTTNNLEISGSLLISGSTLTVRTGTDSGAITASTAIFTNNITNGYPTSNAWKSSLEGSYFNNFDNTTHVSEILRFMAGIISHSIDTSSPTANTKTFASVDTNNNNRGSTDTITGRLPQSYTSLSNATLNYLVHKDWTGVGEKIFDSIDVYHDDGPTYYIDFDSNSGGSTSVQSSVDSELFGLGGLTSGGATRFDVRVIATQSFSDTGSVAAPTETSNTFTTQSYIDYTMTAFGTTSGVELAKIASANPAVIPAAYQDGKFENVGGTALTGSLSRKYGASATDFTSVSSSGYYRFHDLKVGIATGSGAYTFVNGTTKNDFWAPRDTINTAIGLNTIDDSGHEVRSLTCVSRSLSGVPYVTGSTYEISQKITGLFNPMYAGSTTLVDLTSNSVGEGSVTITNDVVSTSGGTIQTANAIYDSTGASARSTGTVPYYNDIAMFTASVDWDADNDENIDQTGLGDASFQVKTYIRNRESTQTNVKTDTIKYHTSGEFGQTAASGSLGIYGRDQGYDGGALTGTTEVFTGESYRIQLLDNVQAFNGTAWTTTFALNQLGNYDLQVKPGYLVDPGGTYRYWYPSSYGSGTYKYYIRRFQTGGSTYSSMTVNLNGNTLIAWNATTNGISCALLFESSGNGSGNNSELSVARIYDPVKTTSNLIEADISADNFKNPFSTAISLYGNSGGSISTGTYTVPIRNADGMYLDSNDNELYVIVRYKGDPTPIDDITLTFS